MKLLLYCAKAKVELMHGKKAIAIRRQNNAKR
jgi:hypothetical protein